jgi:hypothetical protein
MKTFFLSNFVCCQDMIDMARVTLIDTAVEERLLSAFELAKETVDDFTDSPYTSHDNREKVLTLTEQLRDELHGLIAVGRSLVSLVKSSLFFSFFSFLFSLLFYHSTKYICVLNNRWFLYSTIPTPKYVQSAEGLHTSV